MDNKAILVEFLDQEKFGVVFDSKNAVVENLGSGCIKVMFMMSLEEDSKLRERIEEYTLGSAFPSFAVTMLDDNGRILSVYKILCDVDVSLTSMIAVDRSFSSKDIQTVAKVLIAPQIVVR